MFTKQEDIAGLEEKLGKPVVVDWHYEIHPWEYDVVDGSMCDGRAHDVTMFIHRKDDPREIAVISKSFFPPGAFRAPSGAAHPGEGLEKGAIREAYEETGLDIELTRYVARINACFTCDGKTIGWTTHIFEALQTDGVLDPKDTGEISEARWATIDELKGEIRQVLLDANWDLFRYRVALTDLTVKAMEDGA